MKKISKNASQKYVVRALQIAIMLLIVYGCSRPSPSAEASATVGNTNISIHYSQPSVKGRTIWGGLVPYGEVWRTGANEATTFEVSNDVSVEGQPLPAGKYALFTIPGEEAWTIIFSREHDQWGAEEYKQEQDALRVQVQPQQAPQASEQLTFSIDQNGTVSLVWENVQVAFDVDAPE